MQRDDGEFNRAGQRIPPNPYNPNIRQLEPEEAIPPTLMPPDPLTTDQLIFPMSEERRLAWPAHGPNVPIDSNQGRFRVRLVRDPPAGPRGNVAAQADAESREGHRGADAESREGRRGADAESREGRRGADAESREGRGGANV